MERWVVMAGTSVQPTDPLGIVLVIALVDPVVRVQADHTALALHHQGRLPCHLLYQVGSAFSSTALSGSTSLMLTQRFLKLFKKLSLNFEKTWCW